jgi:hypothetical protein
MAQCLERAPWMRRQPPADLSWMTPHSLRRTVATVVRDAAGPAQTQQQLSHAKLRPPRPTICSGRPAAPTSAPCWIDTQVAVVETEVSGKCSATGVSPNVDQVAASTTSGFCAPEGIRTPNLLIRSQMLYPLSYGRLCSIVSYGVATRRARLRRACDRHGWRRREDLNLRSPVRGTTH